MNNYELNNFNMMFIGKGSEYFQSIENEESPTFQKNGLQIGVTEAFGTNEITQVAITIGSGVIAGLSVLYIKELFDKIFLAQKKAKEEGQELEISVRISEKVSIRNIESIQEIEKAMEIVVKKSSK